MFERIWQENLREIRENKVRFAAICILFAVAVILFLADDGGEDIILTENPVPVENVETAGNVDATAKIVTVKNSPVSNANENIKIVLGANSDGLFVRDPFKVPPKEKEITPPVIVQPVAQVQNPKEKFILRGTAIIGANKTALIQKIDGDKKSSEENFILGIGDNLNGKKIIDIAADSVFLDDGEILYLEIR